MKALKLLLEDEDTSEKQLAEEVPDISVVIPVCHSRADLCELYRQYSREIFKTSYSCEFIFVIDGNDPEMFEKQKQLKELDPTVRVLTLNRSLGEAAALAFGFDPVLVRQDRILAATFHPEMTEDVRVHREFLRLAAS